MFGKKSRDKGARREIEFCKIVNVIHVDGSPGCRVVRIRGNDEVNELKEVFDLHERTLRESGFIDEGDRVTSIEVVSVGEGMEIQRVKDAEGLDEW